MSAAANEQKRKRLVVLVPGYQESYAAGSQLSALKNHLELTNKCGTCERLEAGGLKGYRLESGSTLVDLFEADWQASTPLLSSKGWLLRLTWGASLLFSWLRRSTLRRAGGHWSWYRWFFLMFALMLIWWLSAFGTLFSQFPSSWHLCTFKALHIFAWHICNSKFGDFSAVKSLWLAFSFGLIFFGVSVTASVDVADLFRRYLYDTKDDNGIPTRSAVRTVLVECVGSLSDCGYDETVIVGHSFGVLVALDVIANDFKHKIKFISLGGFLGFLAAETDWVTKQIDACLRSPYLLRWADYYSREDVFAASPPLPSTDPRVSSQSVVLGAGFWQRTLGKAHSMYYRNKYVQKAIMEL